jgi:VWFA-related protein
MRALAFVILLFLATIAAAQEQQPEELPLDDAQYSEIIDVVRYALDIRVVDLKGAAISDLTPADFTVTIGGKRATVVSATWVAEGSLARTPAPAAVETDDADLPLEEWEKADATPEVRSIVLLIQTDFARVSERVLGQMKFHYIADRIIEMLGPYDRVAVLSHDSHLKFRRDFTSDHQSIRDAVRESLLIDTPPPPPVTTDGPSLTKLLDAKSMKRAADAESALLVIAKALQAIDGQKMIIIGGWGMGELQGRAGVKLKSQWNDAIRLLKDQRVPVISLNTGLGGELSFGLAATAAATGGFYAGTQNFEGQAISRVAGALAGHYSLMLRLDDLLKPGEYPLRVRVNRKGADVQAPPYVIHGR